LEEHFDKEHFICQERECREKKFVVFGSVIDLEAHRLEAHFTGKKKSRRVEIDYHYTDSMAQRRLTQNVHEPEASSASEPLPSNQYPSLGNARSRAPAGFGQLSQVASSNSSQIDVASTTAPRPEPSIQLTPAQNSILSAVEGLQNLLSELIPSTEHLKKFKIAVHSYSTHNTSAEAFVMQFVNIVEELHPKISFSNTNKATHELLTHMGSTWHRLSDLFVDDPNTVDRFYALQKKQKRKGLNIQEFQELKEITPLKAMMLNAWNDWKVKVR
jgi:hypothetical protein